jgi:hypothetical protein
MFVGAGFNAFGIASGGGAGWVLAQWVIDGEAPLDLWVVDIRRFADMHRDRQWVNDRTLEAYGKHYAIGFPHVEYESGRPRIVSVVSAMAEVEGRKVSLGTQLVAPLQTLRAALDAGQGVFQDAAPKTFTFGERRDTGAKFAKP